MKGKKKKQVVKKKILRLSSLEKYIRATTGFSQRPKFILVK